MEIREDCNLELAVGAKYEPLLVAIRVQSGSGWASEGWMIHE
jgi:hypothetical protein